MVMKNSKPISITPYLDIIFRHRLIALGVFAVGISATISLMVMLNDVYRSTAIIVIEPPQVAADYIDVHATKGPDNLSFANQLEALAYKAFSQQRSEQLIRKFGLYGYGPGKPMEPRLAILESKINIVVPQDTIVYETGRAGEHTPDVLKISFEYYDRVIAQQVTQELSESYVEEGYRERIQRADDATRFLAGQVKQVRSQLDAKDSQIKELERRYEGSLPEELEPNLAELARLQDRLSMINEQLATEPLIPVAPGESAATTPSQELGILEMRLTQIRSEYSDQYPDVVQLRQQIDALRKQINAVPTGALKNPENGGVIAVGQSRLERQTSTLTAQIETLKSRIATIPQHGQELSALQRDYDTLATDYHGLLNKELAAQLNENLEKRHQDERLQVLQPASMARRPIRPNRAAIGIFGFCLSVFTALALPFGVYFTDTSFKDPEELLSEFSIPVVAVIPMIEGGENRLAALRAVAVSSTGILFATGAIWAYTHHLF
jgi:uncharacterized protein involved in exopolysaccharide biosynthesis